MSSVLGFLIILAPLVIFHEFGHFIFARIFGVKAEVFSVGFGPKLLSRQIGETEWRLSAIPLGGYVKLLGEQPDQELSAEERARSLNHAARWKRLLIFFGGPLFNFILAIVAFMLILAIGEEQLSSRLPRIVPGSPAAVAGLRSGDRIVSIDGKPVSLLEEVLREVAEKPGKPLSLGIRREGAAAEIQVSATPVAQDGISQYGEVTHVGQIEGLLPMGRSTRIGVSDPTSLAGRAQVTSGDRVVAIDGKAVSSWEEVEAIYSAAPSGGTLKFGIRKEGGKELPLSVRKGAGQSLAQASGLHSSELFVDKVVPESPAQRAGLKSGDRLVGVGGEDIASFDALRAAVQASGEKLGRVPLRWERDGKVLEASVIPTATTIKDPLLRKTTQFTVGVLPQFELAKPDVVIERILNPVTLLVEGTRRMVTFTSRNLISIGKMVRGEVSVNTLGGPILIGKIAGESLERGINTFLATMAMLSVGLGVLNLLPVPVLDGGHILLLCIEAIRGKPLPMRFLELAQQVGLALILLLMMVVMKNDLSRLPFFD